MIFHNNPPLNDNLVLYINIIHIFLLFVKILAKIMSYFYKIYYKTYTIITQNKIKQINDNGGVNI